MFSTRRRMNNIEMFYTAQTVNVLQFWHHECMWKYTQMCHLLIHIKCFKWWHLLPSVSQRNVSVEITSVFCCVVLLSCSLLNENTQLVLQLYLGFLSRTFLFFIELPYCMMKRRYYHALISIAACFAYTTDISNI